MFILRNDPSWMFGGTIAAIIFFILFWCLAGLFSKFKLETGSRILTVLAGVSTVSFIVIIVLGLFNPDITTVNNPYSVNEEDRSKLVLEINKTEKTITEGLEVDKVEVEEKNIVSQNAAQGNMIDFVAVNEGKLIDGKFYFTEDSLEILVSGESDIFEHVSISTDD